MVDNPKAGDVVFSATDMLVVDGVLLTCGTVQWIEYDTEIAHYQLTDYIGGYPGRKTGVEYSAKFSELYATEQEATAAAVAISVRLIRECQSELMAANLRAHSLIDSIMNTVQLAGVTA